MADQTEQTYPRAVTRYETSDGKTHGIELQAKAWERAINAAKLATLALEGGSDLADAYALFYSLAYEFSIDEGTRAALVGVTRKSKLVISYWQCSDKAGYQPWRINPDGSIYVHGDVGSWSGPYGGDVNPRDLIRYIEDTRQRVGRIPEAA